jgi:hypothetical protein
MQISGWQKQKINILADYQDALAFLYTLYSEKFPAHQDFWLGLALPKLRYADWIRSCTKKIIDGCYRYNMMRFTNEAVLAGNDYLQILIRNARMGDLEQSEAVALAFALESGCIASKFYEIVDQAHCELVDLTGEFKSEKVQNLRKLRHFNSLVLVISRQMAV